MSAIVCLSLENEGSVLSNCALSKPSETKTLATSSPEPPTIGSLWQPKQEFESGPLVRLNGGLTPVLRLVGTIACVALGLPAPSAVVNFALKSTRPRSISAGNADGPAAATASKSTCALGANTRSSQLPPKAPPAAVRTAAAPTAASSPGRRFMGCSLKGGQSSGEARESRLGPSWSLGAGAVAGRSPSGRNSVVSCPHANVRVARPQAFRQERPQSAAERPISS